MEIVLVAGLWLPSSIWEETAAALASAGHHPIPVDLPGVDDGDADATLEDQLTAVLAAVDGADWPLVVGHSAASTLAWLVADRRPDTIAGVALLGGFPSATGAAYAEFFPVVDGVMAFPGWEPFEGPDAADLDAEARSAIEAITVPVAGGVASGEVLLGDDRRFAVPVVLICPEYSPDDARQWIASGDSPELEQAERVSFVDLDSGHWPMVSRPEELATVLGGIAAGLGSA